MLRRGSTGVQAPPTKGDLHPGDWKVNPNTGIVSLTDEVLTRILNPDPMDKYYIIDPDPIARGQFAVVRRCSDRATGVEYAAKFSSRSRMGSDCSADIVHEIAICFLLKTTHRVVQLVDVFSNETHFVLILEYASGGDLQTILDDDLVPYERNVIHFLRQLLEGLLFVHDRNIVHLDLKPQNLVLMEAFPEGSVKLCDFEISRMLTPGRDIREILGTADYVAPEIIHYEPITTKTDMWSFGVLTYVLLTGFLPFGGDNDQETFLEITRGELDFPDELFGDVSTHAIDFIKRLLIRQPQLRMSAKECLSHRWMQAEVKLQKRSTSSLYANSSVLDSPNSRFNSSSYEANRSGGNVIVPLVHSGFQEHHEMEFDLVKAYEILNDEPPSSLVPKITLSSHVFSTPGTPIENGLPTYYPQISSTFCPSMHSSTSSLNRSGSRQSLERLRSISKSREILVERLQLSSQKKTLSRSRERLFDSRFGPRRSQGVFWEDKSFSHSVEALSPSPSPSHCTFLRNSSQYFPFVSIFPVYDDSFLKTETKSSAANYKFASDEPDRNRRISCHDEKSISSCNAVLNHNSSLNRKAKTKERNRSSSNTKGPSRTRVEHPKCCAVRKASRKDSRWIWKEKERGKPKNWQQSLLIKKKENQERKRGSVFHVEQRIRKRHERMLEMQKSAEKSGPKTNTNKGHVAGPQKGHVAGPQKAESKSTCLRNSAVRGSFSSKDPKLLRANDGQRGAKGDPKATSVPKGGASNTSHSILAVQINLPNNNSSNRKTKSIQNSNCSEDRSKRDLIKKNQKNVSKSPPISKTSQTTKIESEKDYRTNLNDFCDDGIFSRSDSMESKTSIGSGCTIKAANTSGRCAIKAANTSEDGLKRSFEKMKLRDTKEGTNLKNQIRIVVTPSPKKPPNEAGKGLKKEQDASRSYLRSLSSTSDVGSMFSEGSESTSTDEASKSQKCPDNQRGAKIPDAPTSTPKSLSICPKHNALELGRPILSTGRSWDEDRSKPSSVVRASQTLQEKLRITSVARKFSDPSF